MTNCKSKYLKSVILIKKKPTLSALFLPQCIVFVDCYFKLSPCFLWFALRNLRSPHIVQFYGATFREVPRGVEAVFVTEQCGESLKSYLVEHSGNNPADNSLTVAPAVLRWAQQIVDALIVVHSKGYVHGDLRLVNVLVSQGLVFVIVCLRVGLFVCFTALNSPSSTSPAGVAD